MAALRIVLQAVPSGAEERGVLPAKDGGAAPVVVTLANFESAFGLRPPANSIVDLWPTL